MIGADRVLSTEEALPAETRAAALTVIGYGRASTLELAAGHTMTTQRETVERWAEGQSWRWAGWYEDPGVSGRHSENRPGLQDALARVREGGISAILVRRRDRLARNLGDVALIERELQKYGCHVLSHDEPSTNEASPSGYLNRGLHDLLAAHYSIELGAKVASGWKTRASKGLMLNVPFGYVQRGDPRVEPPALVENEAAAIAYAFSAFATGMTMVVIAEEFNRRGLRTRYRARRGQPNEAGRLWTSQSIAALLGNPVYMGMVTHHGEIVREGAHEAILEPALFKQVQRLRMASRGRPASPQRQPYVLRGIVRCSRCLGSLQGNHGGKTKRIRYYREVASKRRGVPCDAPQVSVRADFLEAEVDAIVARFHMPEDVRERVLTLLQHDDGEDDLDVRRRRLDERLRRLNRLYRDLQLDDGEYDAQRRAIEAERDRFTVPMEQAVTAAETFDVLQLAWSRATPEEKRALAVTLFEAVYVDMATKAIVDVVVQPAFRAWLSDWR